MTTGYNAKHEGQDADGMRVQKSHIRMLGENDRSGGKSDQQVVSAILLDLLLLQLTTGAVSVVPLLDASRIFGEDALSLRRLGSFHVSFILRGIASQENLDLATTSKLLAEPTFPFILDDFFLDAVDDPQCDQKAVAVCS